MTVLTKNNLYEELEKWYTIEKPLYGNLADKVGLLIEDILKENGVEYHSITSRAKDVESVLNKAKLKKYKNPQSDIQDFAGIRVITFVKSDVIKACELIKPQFEIDEVNSADKGEELGEDRVGYRSVHYVATFKDDRLSLPEYKKFVGLNFEIQIRTILEHSWADISHDRTYKFNNNLTNVNDIRRRFALAAASLEMVDREFDRLANELEQLSIQVADGNLNYAIDGTSLLAYLDSKFGEELLNKSVNPELINIVLEELSIMNVITLADLDNIIKELVGEDVNKLILIEYTNYIGLIRHILILKYKEEYFEKAWRNSWQMIEYEELEFFNDFGLDYYNLAYKFGLKTGDEYDDEYDDDDYIEKMKKL